MNTDIYQRVTDQIVAELEKGVRPWLKPWNADHAAGRITRPLRANGDLPPVFLDSDLSDRRHPWFSPA